MKHVFALFLCAFSALFAAPPTVGERPPAFSLTNLNGEFRQLGAGPVVLVVLRGFPGYQCPLCNRQTMDFIKAAPEFKKAGARVVLVYPGLLAKANEFVTGKTFPQHFELLIDPYYAFTNQFGLRWDEPNETAYPATFVIGKDGLIKFAKISKSHGGRVTAAEALEALASLGR